MQPLKILYVITKLELGGAQKQLLSIIRGLDRQKFQPYLFTSKGGLLDPDADAIEGLKVETSTRLKRRISPFDDLLAIWQIRCFIKKNNIDIVHTHSSKAGIIGRIAARLARAHVIIHTVHGWSFNAYQHPLLRYLYIRLEKIAAGFSRALIVVCEHDRQKGLKSGIGRPDKYFLIRYGIDRAAFIPGSSVSELVICTVSCLKPQKAPQDFIRLAASISKKYNNLRFVLVGDGILRGQIEKMIHRLGLQQKVKLYGWQRDVAGILATADIFVLTSLWEGLPIAVLEALSCGLPVVATHTGGIAEVIEQGKNGFLVLPQDIAGMEEKLAVLLQDADARKRISAAARDSLKADFAVSQMLANTQQLYLSLISPGN
jgi:glycosyltransferase involved in cell wall biosynthesis